MSESAETARRRRAAALLGDLLPSQTRDDLDDQSDHAKGDTSRDQQIADDVPPHHGH